MDCRTYKGTRQDGDSLFYQTTRQLVKTTMSYDGLPFLCPNGNAMLMLFALEISFPIERNDTIHKEQRHNELSLSSLNLQIGE